MDRLSPHQNSFAARSESEPDFGSSEGISCAPAPEGRYVSLAELPFLGKARIVGFDGASDDPSLRRLFELGLHPGTEVAVCHRAPLGDPRCYGFRGTHVCLRRSETSRIQVEILSERS